MKALISLVIAALIIVALAPSTMSYGITAFLNGVCITAACGLSFALGQLSEYDR